MKLIHNEQWYELKCIEYFFDRGIVVCGLKATISSFIPITFFYFENRKKGLMVDFNSWKELYNHKERWYKKASDVLRTKE